MNNNLLCSPRVPAISTPLDSDLSHRAFLCIELYSWNNITSWKIFCWQDLLHPYAQQLFREPTAMFQHLEQIPQCFLDSIVELDWTCKILTGKILILAIISSTWSSPQPVLSKYGSSGQITMHSSYYCPMNWNQRSISLNFSFILQETSLMWICTGLTPSS